MDEYTEVSNPIDFKKYGRYQILQTLIVILMGVLYYWENANYSAYAQVRAPYCAYPANVSSACSTDCKRIQYSQTRIIENFNIQFNFVCAHKLIAKNMGWLTISGTISGAICWYYFSNRFGRPIAITVGCCLSIFFDMLLLLFHRLDMYLLNRFAQAFSGNGIYVNGQVLLTEIIPKNYLNVFMFIKLLAINISQFCTSCIWELGNNWIWIIIGRMCLTFIGFILSFYIYESPRWHFVRDNTNAAIASAEKILKFNKESTVGVRNHVEKVWRYSRTRPVPKDSFIALFYNMVLRRLYFQYIFMTVALVFGNNTSMKRIYTGIKVRKLFLLDIISNSMFFIGLIVWFWISKNQKGKKIFIIGFLLGSYTFMMILMVEGIYVIWSLSLVTYLVTQILLHEVQLYLLEFIPVSIRSTAIITNIVVFFISVQVAEQIQKLIIVVWFPVFLTSVLFFIACIVSVNLIEGRLMPFREFVSETEVNLRRIIATN